MLWQTNICRICARISELCIPIFQQNSAAEVDAKIRKCLNANISKDDLKPKQVCQDCFIKLTEFYNFVALFHESNYRFETLLYESAQGTTVLPTQSCVGNGVNLDLSVVENSNAHLIPSKPDDIADCTSLGLMVECKGDILPLQNLDLQARDFGEQNILSDIVGQGDVNNVDIDVQNFVVPSGENQLYPQSEDCTILRNTNPNYLGKLRSLHPYLNSQDVEINLVNGGEFIKPAVETILPKSETDSFGNIQNGSFTQNIYAHNIIINNSGEVKPKTNTNGKHNKLTIISVETIRKPAVSKKQAKFEINQTKEFLSRPRKINCPYKTEPSEILQMRSLPEHNILNDIANQTSDIDIDNIDVQNLVCSNDNQIYTDVSGNNLMKNPNLDRIDNIQKVYLNLEQHDENTDRNRNCVDPLACTTAQSLPAETIVIDDSEGAEIKNKNFKRRNKVNIISVTEIRKMIEKRPLDLIVKKRPRLNKAKKGDKYQIFPLKPFQSKTKEGDENSIGKAKRFPCNSCGKTFKRRHHLNEHMKKHNSVRPYICDVCNKSFAVQWDLTFHKRVHTDLYKCHTCTKCFSSSSKLERHVRIHTGEKPFVCPEKDCGRSFSDKRNLIGHQVTHTNIRKFACDMCKGMYKTKSQLKDHMQAHRDGPGFQCNICDKSYKWKTNLVMHMKKHKELECEDFEMNSEHSDLMKEAKVGPGPS